MSRTLPRHVYHLAEAANWPSIRQGGLHSASVLLRRAGLSQPQRDELERRQRSSHILLPGGIQIRDQRPMPANALDACLVGMTPAEWYAMINARVFFWLDPNRLNRQRAACGRRPQVVLIVDTGKLVAAYKDRIALTAINTGNARRRPALRGAATFVSFQNWMTSQWAEEAAGLGIRARRRSQSPVELTVLGSVPDVINFVVRTQWLKPDQVFDPARVTVGERIELSTMPPGAICAVGADDRAGVIELRAGKRYTDPVPGNNTAPFSARHRYRTEKCGPCR